MTPAVVYTIIFGSLASTIAIAAMVQNYLQRQRRTQVPNIEARRRGRHRTHRPLPAKISVNQVQRPKRAVLRP
ncbi:hypothetical protein F4680DRAFT_423165 [Xylaria scruposa]|nr:hypothetical protein F4680DRAFT_423165 [Xylaria scruposa]